MSNDQCASPACPASEANWGPPQRIAGVLPVGLSPHFPPAHGHGIDKAKNLPKGRSLFPPQFFAAVFADQDHHKSAPRQGAGYENQANGNEMFQA